MLHLFFVVCKFRQSQIFVVWEWVNTSWRKNKHKEWLEITDPKLFFINISLETVIYFYVHLDLPGDDFEKYRICQELNVEIKFY